KGVTLGVGNGHERVIERGHDVGDPNGNITPSTLFCLLGVGTCFGHGWRSLRMTIDSVNRATTGHDRRLTQVLHTLLAGDRLLGALAGPGIGFRALATYRQATSMANATVAADVAESRNILAHLPPQLPFANVILVEQGRQPRHFVFAQFVCPDRRVDTRLVAQLAGDFVSHAIEVLKRNDRRTIGRNVDTQQTWHNVVPVTAVGCLFSCCANGLLTLPLLVAGVLA